MPVNISVGPPHLAISWGETVLLTDASGQIGPGSKRGLFFFDTRLISRWRIYANGTEWDLLNGGSPTYHASRAFMINRCIATQEGEIPAGTISLVLSRSIETGIHEDLDVTNNGQEQVHFNLEIEIQGDFADIFEVKSGNVVDRANITTDWSAEDASLRLSYRKADFFRQLVVRRDQNEQGARYANGRITFEIVLAPHQSWHTCLLYDLHDGDRRFAAPQQCLAEAQQKIEERDASWRQAVTKTLSGNADFSRAFQEAVSDMGALRLPIKGTTDTEFVPAGGIPWFATLFGRDSLIAALQSIVVYPDFAGGALDVLGSLQAKERDDYRDAEPGKIPHELRQGELAHFKLIPHTPYYGTADATPLYLILLHAAWRSSGDLGVVERHLATAEGCLDWIDKYGDRDGDGFQEYQTRSPAGYENQSWKDAKDAIVYPDGSLVKGPKATCELQGYVYDAWLRMAELYDELGRADDARRLREKAQALFHRFNEAFWSEEQGFYALALDGDKRPAFSVASNPGHCLWSGIVPHNRARRIVERLMRPDMWSGWGIRTLSAEHPAYNPYSYQNGAVWPHDNAIIALGFRQYGFAAEAMRVAQGITDAASYFVMQRLPELYAGVEKTTANFPVQYLGANVPQAWAAGSMFFLLECMLGIRPDAPRRMLNIDPILPDWLPDLTVHDLRIGDQLFDFSVRRQGEETTVELIRGDPSSFARRPFGFPVRSDGVGETTDHH